MEQSSVEECGESLGGHGWSLGSWILLWEWRSWSTRLWAIEMTSDIVEI